MVQLKFEGDTLGQRHRNYNNVIKKDHSTQSEADLSDIDVNVDDVNNLYKIDVASKTRNLEYILRVLKGNDMLYVSRAIKQCQWLITDSQYAHIFNPEYLHSQLFPHMMSKATNKLMLHIRLNLRDESRVESFFNFYEKFNLDLALKWLPHCSLAFAEAKVEKYADSISTALVKRLCEKHYNILSIYVNKVDNWSEKVKVLQATIFLLQSHTDFYLELIEQVEDYRGYRSQCLNFNSKITHFIMKVRPERVHQNFHKYAKKLDIPTFVKFLNPNQIEDFLLKQARTHEDVPWSWLNYNNVQYFITRMPQEQRLGFVKKVFIDKNFDQNKDDSDNIGMAKLYGFITRRGNYFTEFYNWYHFAPFEVALAEMKEIISNNKFDDDKLNNRKNMLDCLLKIVSRDQQQLEPLLVYYNDNHLTDSLEDKIKFTTDLCKSTNLQKCTIKCWDLLNNIFKSINNSKKSERVENSHTFESTEEEIFVQAIIIHKVINKEDVQDLMSALNFKTLKHYRKTLNPKDSLQLFELSFDYLMNKIKDKRFTDETKLRKHIHFIKLLLTLLNDWKMDIADYPEVINEIRELIKIKEADISWIYNVNKKWRKSMFEESITLCPSEKTYINALKHDPSLLSRNEKVVATMRCDDNASLKQFLSKLKIYWPESLGSEWIEAYRQRLKEPLGHKALMRGLCILLPQTELLSIINHYKPEDTKVDWANNDENVLCLRKHIAKNMHVSRPQPDPSVILEYAKGDYLQFALPSLNAIFYNLCAIRCREFIPTLLNSPVSLQKHGIRIAFNKMQSDDLQKLFCDYWKTVANSSIRAVIFKQTYELICKEKNPEKIENIWNLLDVCIDSLTFEEDKKIYTLLSMDQKIPLQVKPFYLMKSYKFFKSFLPMSGPDRDQYETILNSFIYIIDQLIESMEPGFVEDILKDYITAVYTTEKTDVFIHTGIIQLMVSYLLLTASEDTQLQRYEMVLTPVLNHTLAVWTENEDKNSIVTKNFEELLNNLTNSLRQVVIKNMVIPATMYANIQSRLEESLPLTENYLILREWKLTTAFTKILKEEAVERSLYQGEDDKYWDALCTRAAPAFGNRCVEFMKEDIKLFFPCIYGHFAKVLKNFLNNLNNLEFEIAVFNNFLKEDVIQSYLVTIKILPGKNHWSKEFKEKIEKLHQLILSHSSLEVKMHYYHHNKETLFRM